MRHKTSFRLLCAGLLCLSLLLCFLRPAGAADTSIDWNPKFTPSLPRAQALRLARRHLGEKPEQSRLEGEHLVSMDKSHSAGEWRFQFADARHKNHREVVVAFRKDRQKATVRVYHGAVAR
jgi:hypothetical protein